MHRHHEPMTQLPAGKFEFPDMGIYIGEWFESKAVGLGLMTREKGQGEYTGYWNNGKEECGVFLWPNAPGAMYQGDWAHSKRHGFGIFRKEDYMIMGEFRDDIIRTGVSCREGGGTKFEGDFDEGLPIFGVETYPDGGTYCGQYVSAKRQGYGKRTSIAYGEMVGYYPDEAARFENHRRRDSYTSQGSGGSFIGGHRDDNRTAIVNAHMTPLSARRAIRSNAPFSQTRKFRCGFVLPGNKSDLLVKRLRKADDKRARGKSQSLSSVLSAKLLRSKSADPFRRRTGDGSFRSAFSANTTNTIGSTGTGDWQAEDPIEPETVEGYAGEWSQDERHGYGVCKRSDGVYYEGQWQHNLRHGYGVTHFPDGTYEAGRYNQGRLTFLAGKRNPLFFMYTFPINKTIENAVKRAQEAEQIAEDRYREAQSKLAEVRDMVQRAKLAATAACEYSLETRELVKELYPEFEQPGVRILESTVKMMKVSKRINTAFETALRQAEAVLNNEIVYFTGIKEGEVLHHEGDALHRCDSLHRPPSPGMKRSRHGSFRASFRHNRHGGGGQIGSQHTQPGVTVVRQPALKVRAHAHEGKRKRRGAAAKDTLMVPGGFQDLDDGNDQAYEEDIQMTNASMTQSSLQPPTIQYPGNNQEGSPHIDNGSTMSTEDRGESETMSFVEVEDCELPRLDPHSDIPTIPFTELLNSTVLSDHFDFYAHENDDQTVKKAHKSNISSAIIFGKNLPVKKPTVSTPFCAADDSEHPTIPPPPNYSPQKHPITAQMKQTLAHTTTGVESITTIPQKKIKSNPSQPISIKNNNTTTIGNSNIKISRTRTLPSLMTCDPIQPKSILTLRADTMAEKKLVVEEIPSNNSPMEEINSRSLYLIENGARKRATPLWREDNNKQPKSNEQITKEKAAMKSAILDSVTGEQFLIQPPQDKLTSLPKTYLIESQSDLRKDLGEGSLPDMTVWNSLQENSLSDTELQRLVDEYQQSKLVELKRRKQGEIIIHMTNLLDWCYQHFTLLIIIFINALLTYFFYILITHNPDS